MSSFPFSFMFSVIPVFVFLMFGFVFATIIVRAVKGANQWSKNNNSPVMNAGAIVVSKRQDVSYTHMDGDNMHHSSHTNYYVTFEVESGDRMEYSVNGTEYGMLVEGDTGKLTFQGTRYLGFQRQQG